MINYPYNIQKSGLSIYDPIDSTNHELYIPTEALQKILETAMIGFFLNGYPFRTRSKIVKEAVCHALGYPIPTSFKKTQPRFPGQNFDVYTQKSLNVQIWNEEVDSERRYVFFRVDSLDQIVAVKIISGDELAIYDRTGKLTQKYQARMSHYYKNICSMRDSHAVNDWIIGDAHTLIECKPNDFPDNRQLLRIRELYKRLLPMVGKSVSYLDAVQERNRGAELHAMICKHLGYAYFDDDGSYPDIMNQLLEVKLQTSPTIDLGLHSPEDEKIIIQLRDVTFYSRDVRYAVFDGEQQGNRIFLTNLYLVTGEDFTNYFPLFKGKGTNSKIQIPLPYDFFD